jgi:AraC family transcriptional regulator
MELLIKNMVCPRCIEAVKDALEDSNIKFETVELGKVRLDSTLSPTQKESFSKSLEDKGFELLESRTSALISQIKTLIIEQIHHSNQRLGENFSSFLAERLGQEYSSFSKLFSQVEGITIEKYVIRQRVERVKEFLFYDQLSLSEIAFKMDYSSVAHLSSQFKKETGMTPTEFKKSHSVPRKSLDKI